MDSGIRCSGVQKIDPLFIITGLTAGQVYQVYVSAANDGAESQLSEPVNATPVLAIAA